MNRIEHLLTCLIEECAEVQKEATKSLRFGIHDTYIGTVPQIERLTLEICDLIAEFEMLESENIIPAVDIDLLKREKKEKVAKYMEYARERDTLS